MPTWPWPFRFSGPCDTWKVGFAEHFESEVAVSGSLGLQIGLAWTQLGLNFDFELRSASMMGTNVADINLVGCFWDANVPKA